MIELNLLPEDLQKENKFRSIPTFLIKKVAIAFIALLALVHLFVLFSIFFVNAKKINLKKNLSRPEVKEKINQVKTVEQELNTLKESSGVVADLINRKLSYTKILHSLNKYTATGMWFDNLAVSGSGLSLNGKVVSLQADEMAGINNFLKDLKSDRNFISFFSTLVLDSSTRITYRNKEVVKFIITGTFK